MSKCQEWGLGRIETKVEQENLLVDVLFELTHRCPLDCIHCYTAESGHSELPHSKVIDILDQLVEAGCLFLTLSGGEPLMREDFFDIATYAKKKGFGIRILTNGTLITEQVADRIAQLHPIMVGISLYSTKSSIHDSVTRIPGSHRRTMRGIRLLAARGVRLSLRTILMDCNIGELEQLEEVANNFGAEYQASPAITPRANGDRGPLKYRVSDEGFRKFIRWSTSRDHPQDAQTEPNRKASTNRRVCGVGEKASRIAPDGKVYPCVEFPLPAGGLQEQSLRAIWRSSPLLKSLRSLRIKDLPVCSKCDMLSMCRICVAQALAEEGDLTAPVKESCRYARILKEVLEDESQGKEDKSREALSKAQDRG